MKLRANSIVKLKGASEIKPGALFDIADETIARRLIDVGYAIAVDDMPSEAPKLVTPNASMSLAALKELALQYGVDASKKRSKDEVIALIVATGKEPQ